MHATSFAAVECADVVTSTVSRNKKKKKRKQCILSVADHNRLSCKQVALTQMSYTICQLLNNEDVKRHYAIFKSFIWLLRRTLTYMPLNVTMTNDLINELSGKIKSPTMSQPNAFDIMLHIVIGQSCR